MTATDYVWKLGTVFESDFDATDAQEEDSDFWNNIFEDELLDLQLAPME